MNTTEELLKNAFVDMMDVLDWDAIAAYYKAENWTWRGNPNTPTVEELKETVIHLINSTIANRSGCSTGGFCVRATPRELRIEVQKTDTKTWISTVPFGCCAHPLCGKDPASTNPIVLYFNEVANYFSDFPEEYNHCP